MIDKSFIFLAGHHRSGTSLLYKVFREHPQISGFANTGVPEDEGQHLQSVYEPARTLGGPGKYIYHPRAYMDERHELASEETANRIFNQWKAHLDLDRRYLIEKSPPNLVRTRFLQALFPASRFIVLLRHPLAVAYATQKWSKTSIKSLVEHTLVGYEIFRRDLSHLNQAYVLRYEDFVCEPQTEINKIYLFLQIDPAPVRQDIRSDVNEQYFQRWRDDRTHILRRQSFRITADLERRTNDFGYSLDQPAELLPTPILGAHPMC